jgi:hypothetical protein
VVVKATIKFLNDWTQSLDGDLEQGGELAVDYDIKRLPARRDTFRGAAVWDIFALARFRPDGQILAVSVTTPVSSSPGGMTVDRAPAIASFPVPGDSASVELWFLNIGYAPFGEPPKAWDSNFGENYVFSVRPNPTAKPVVPRTDARPARDSVNAMQLAIEKERHRFGDSGAGIFAGSELQTRVKLTAWVRNIAYAKNVWFDAHVFDGGNQLVQAQTLPLHYKIGAGGGGDLFEFGDVLYHGSRGQPGSVSPRPDARRVQLRLYFEASGQLFTDGILHDRHLVEDDVVH